MENEIEAGEWKIFFKDNPTQDLQESYTQLVFRLKDDPREIKQLSKEDLQQLKKDLEDLGKWRKFKELKKDLGE
jgi:hypothetical protein